jgi:hypothetical protein
MFMSFRILKSKNYEIWALRCRKISEIYIYDSSKITQVLIKLESKKNKNMVASISLLLKFTSVQ